MAKLHCPVPGCPKANFRRQTDVNSHLCDYHHIDMRRQHGGNMEALLRTQQQQFSEWLAANGHPNVTLFADVPIDQTTGQEETDDNVHEAEQEVSDGETQDDTTGSTKSNGDGTQVDMMDGIEDLLRMIETTDESGLDVGPIHANDTHTIVCEDDSLRFADQSAEHESYNQD